jgi:hypothetical protein
VAILGVVLLIAAAMKAYWPVIEAPKNAGWLSHPTVVFAAVEWEIGLGIWLLSGLYPRAAWYTALACFTAFAGVSFYKGFSGAASCGCFGRMQTNPWYTAGFDAAAVVALLSFLPGMAGATWRAPSPTRNRFIIATALVCAVLAGGITVSRMPQSLLAGEANLTTVGSLVLLEPEKWIGNRFPLADHIDLGSQLRIGQWLVVLYRGDCPTCQKLVPQIDQLTQAGSVSVALIEMPPYQTEALKLDSPQAAWVAGRLSDRKEWFATTPVVILLDNGIVRGISEGENVLKINDGAQESPRLGLRDDKRTALAPN